MKLKWAIGENSNKAEDSELLDLIKREIVWFDILDFYKHTCIPWKIDPDNLTYRHERKIDRVRKHIYEDGWLDPSDVRRMHDDGINIRVEGRHRLIAAYQLGEKYAPFSVPKELVDKLKAMVKTKDAEI